jgi:predicted transcriptional regulator of viral defense system
VPISRRELQRRLNAVAFRQAGYFTAAQAREAGYSYQAQKYHRDRGNWLVVDRGLFRYPGWPSSRSDSWVRWCVWAGPDGVISHETGLSVHEISDANPAEVHLTVPARFGRADPAVRLHRAALDPADVEVREGFRVTTPLRTILDVADGTLSRELLDGAVRDAVDRAMLTPADLWREVGGRSDRVSWRLIQALEGLS